MRGRGRDQLDQSYPAGPRRYGHVVDVAALCSSVLLFDPSTAPPRMPGERTGWIWVLGGSAARNRGHTPVTCVLDHSG